MRWPCGYAVRCIGGVSAQAVAAREAEASARLAVDLRRTEGVRGGAATALEAVLVRTNVSVILATVRDPDLMSSPPKTS
jgi:hypothetical protein